MANAMFIIANYELKVNLLGEIIYKSLENAPVCPCCGTKMKYRDSRKRIMRREGGEKQLITVRRFYCGKCRRLHTELPDCLSPYKHYQCEVIEGVVDGVVTADDNDSEDNPCNTTMNRWLQWIAHNRPFIEGYLRMVGNVLFDLGGSFLMSAENMLDNIREKYHNEQQHWLGIINRIVYNTGASLEPYPPS